MNSFTLAVASIRSRPLHSVLCMLAVASGIALLCAVFLFSQAVSSGFTRNAQGVDIIVGAKGSPLQLVLSSVYHADIPAGNINMQDYKKLKRDPRVRKAIPMAMGDSYKGFRMVGSTADYLDLYGGEYADGRVFEAPLETVAGANTGLKVGEQIAVTHGFSAESDDVHDAHLYTITGVLKPTGTVIDKLLVSPYESVQQLHGGHDHHDHDDHAHKEDNHHGHGHHESKGDDHGHDKKHHDEHAHEDKHEHDHQGHGKAHGDKESNKVANDDLGQQITAVILKVRGPFDLMNLPRKINGETNVMAAVPSYEMMRFTKSLGIGRQLIVVLAVGFIILSSLMLLASLASGLALHRYDLAVLRVLGASPLRLSLTVIAESLVISGAGALIGVVVGHLLAYGAVISIESLRGLVLAESVLMPQAMDGGFILIGLVAGLIASFVPSLTAARTDIAGLLAKGRV